MPPVKKGYHTGHLIGDRFGGSPELDNLVSQAKKVNLGSYKSIENLWTRALKENRKVTVAISINYTPGAVRPSSFDVLFNIDGVCYHQIIKNQGGNRGE